MVGRDVNLSLWPCVDTEEEKVDPLRNTRVAELLRDEDMERCLLQPWAPVQEGRVYGITTNTQGQVVTVGMVSVVLCLEVFDRTGKHLYSCKT